MGMPMAINLVKAGHELSVFDAVPALLDQAASHGMTTCLFAAQAVENADIIVTMLPNGEIVRKVFGEIVPGSKAGSNHYRLIHH